MAITRQCAKVPAWWNFRKFPDRYFDVAAIAEQHAVTFAAGTAIGGYKPVVASTLLAQRARLRSGYP